MTTLTILLLILAGWILNNVFCNIYKIIKDKSIIDHIVHANTVGVVCYKNDGTKNISSGQVKGTDTQIVTYKDGTEKVFYTVVK